MTTNLLNSSPTRRQLVGIEEVEAAFSGGNSISLLLVASDTSDAACLHLAERAKLAGIAVRKMSRTSLWRLAKVQPTPEILALLGPSPAISVEDALARGGAAWLLVNLAYPGNTGFAIRSAEVSGADACFIDNEFGHEAKREALRASMRADLFMPVFWQSAQPLLDSARGAGRQIIAIEDVGKKAPWEVDLRGPILFVVGGERRGIPQSILADSHTILRIPVEGFIPSYNLQAAMAVVLGERLRQRHQSEPTGR